MGLLHNTKFLIYNLKVACTNFGYTLYMFTIPAYSLLISHSILFTGVTLFVEYGIYSLTFLTGPLVDKVEDKRYVIFSFELLIGICSIILGILMESEIFVPWLFLLLIGLIGVGWDFVWTADYYVMPLIVSKDDLLRANAYSNAVGSGHVSAGLFVGGAFLVLLGAYGSILTYGVCMFTAAILTLMIPLPVRSESRKLQGGFKSGWNYVLKENRDLLILSAVVLPIFSFFGSAPTLAITNIFVEKSALLYSLMFSLFYVGSTVIQIIVGKYNPVKQTGRLIVISYLISGVFLSLSVFWSSFYVLDAVLWFILGATSSLSFTLYSTYLQAVSEREMLGRVNANLYTFRGITSTAGTITIPLFVILSGDHVPYILLGLLEAVLAILVISFSASVKRISIGETGHLQ